MNIMVEVVEVVSAEVATVVPVVDGKERTKENVLTKTIQFCIYFILFLC